MDMKIKERYYNTDHLDTPNRDYFLQTIKMFYDSLNSITEIRSIQKHIFLLNK